ncbi:peptidase M4 [Clostridium polyendosporum]|uniref:Neutral metalloproteinase n=1 Tax=Clostridium polyendosporum TaxID=69208 RepID=A0A919S1N1_9CLOT|nr:M4 family metallopeptidase [Clostridium polyendosporum]GIM30204.1 peptidase M4 [Clostridium polyendosporum]
MKIKLSSKLFNLLINFIKKNKDCSQELSEKDKVILKLQKLSGGDLKIDFHENNGLQVFICGRLSDMKEINESSVLDYLEENKAIFGLSESINNFVVINMEKDQLGYTKFTVNQLINGSIVSGKELVLHFDENGIIKSIVGSVVNGIRSVTYLEDSNITEQDAIEIAKSQFNYVSLRFKPRVDKQVVIMNNMAHEVYKVNIQYSEPEIANWDILIEVSSGMVLDTISNIRYDGPATGSGIAVDGSIKTLNLYLSLNSYQMIDTSKPMSGSIKTYTAENQSIEPGIIVENSTNSFITEKFKAPVSAHYYTGVVYDFYKDLFNRDSIDNKGMNIISTTHYGNAYNNAFWDGNQMVYGDGDGREFTYLSGGLDIIGHELTHGVTDYTANLNYKDQSGALNESISDVFGILVKTYYKYDVRSGGDWAFDATDWVIGEEVYTPNISGDALRSLANPKLYDQPDHMSGYVNTNSDNGGVHINSGIPNKAAYLILQSIGCSKTAMIYYRALTNYLTSNSDFIAARNALIQSASDLYGSSSEEVNVVSNAFDSVGIIAISDAYEPNNMISQAYLITSGNIYSSYISSSNDIDYYKFFANNENKISIKLTNLPKDYDLYLYDSNGTLLAKSKKIFTFSESIRYVAKYTGIYYILVKGYNGVYSTSKKYNLKVTFQ